MGIVSSAGNLLVIKNNTSLRLIINNTLKARTVFDILKNLLDSLKIKLKNNNIKENDPIILSTKNKLIKAEKQVFNLKNNVNKIIKNNNEMNDSIKTFKNINNTIKLALKTLSSIPIPASTPPGIGVPVSLILSMSKQLNNLEADTNGLTMLISNIEQNQISNSKDLNVLIRLIKNIENLIFEIKKLLNIEDRTKSDIIIEDEQQFVGPIQETYKGFRFNIKEEESEIPNVYRSYAEAIDKNGIVVLKSESSFTTTVDILIEELKLIIDSQNLIS